MSVLAMSPADPALVRHRRTGPGTALARIRPTAALLALVALAVLTVGCGERPSTAADEYIAQAADAEEREGLVQARDDIDAEMRAVAAEKDAEIERLRKENEALKARLAARAKR